MPTENSETIARGDVAELKRRLEIAVKSVCPAWLANQHDDLVQAGLIKLIRGESQEPVNASFIYRVAHSVIVDEIRKVRRRKEDAMTDSLPDRLATPSGDGPAPKAAASQLATSTLECVNLLAEDRRRAVTLHLQGHTIPEIGDLLGFPAKRAENLVYRGMADLRDCLRKKGIAP